MFPVEYVVKVRAENVEKKWKGEHKKKNTILQIFFAVKAIFFSYTKKMNCIS